MIADGLRALLDGQDPGTSEHLGRQAAGAEILLCAGLIHRPPLRIVVATSSGWQGIFQRFPDIAARALVHDMVSSGPNQGPHVDLPPEVIRLYTAGIPTFTSSG